MGRNRKTDPPSKGSLSVGEGEDDRPWRIRFDKNVLANDVDEVGYAAMDTARKVIEKKLKIDPLGYGAPLKRELKGLYKIKTSDIRIVYHVKEDAREVWILMIGNRRDIWAESVDEIVARRGELSATPPVPPLADVARNQRR